MEDQTYYNIDLNEFPEYMVSIFRALMKNEKFRFLVSENFKIRHWISEGNLIRVEIIDKETNNKYLN
tara:strand:+ start:578 stop:778 length:201 start_codon:yes stop_codon:yes gene_type:complete